MWLLYESVFLSNKFNNICFAFLLSPSSKYIFAFAKFIDSIILKSLFSNIITNIGIIIENIYISIFNNMFNLAPNNTSTKLNPIPIASNTKNTM